MRSSHVIILSRRRRNAQCVDLAAKWMSWQNSCFTSRSCHSVGVCGVILPQCRCLWGDLATVSVSVGRSCHSVGVCRVILPQCRLSGPILPDLLESQWRGLRTSAVPYGELAAALSWAVGVESLRLSLSRLPWSPQRAVRTSESSHYASASPGCRGRLRELYGRRSRVTTPQPLPAAVVASESCTSAQARNQESFRGGHGA